MHMLGSLPYGGTEYSRAEKASGTTQGRRATARDSGQLSAVMVALVFAALSQGRGKPAPLQRLAVRRLPLFQLERLVQRPHRHRTCFSSIKQVIRISLRYHLPFSPSRQAIISSSARTASSTGTTGRASNTNEGNIEQNW